jgi:hypothetical protein
MFRSILRWEELDFARMSMDSFEVGAISGAVLGTDDLTTLVGLHAHQCFIVLQRWELGSYR